MQFIRIIFESGINNRPPGTKLRRSRTKGRRRPALKTEMTNKWQKKVSITVPEMTTLMTSIYLFKTRQVYLVINLSVKQLLLVISLSHISQKSRL